MNREIKFKAWDNKKKCLFTPVYEAYKGNLSELCLNLRGSLALRTTTGFYGTHPDDTSGQSLNERFTLCQFTGLKDKNGREIYEGDILKEEFTPSHVVAGPVYFDESVGTFAWKPGQNWGEIDVENVRGILGEEGPWAEAVRIVSFLDQGDPKAVSSVVMPRGPGCYPGMLEASLVNKGEQMAAVDAARREVL